MDTSAIVLQKILETSDLDSWSRIKAAYIDSAYTTVFSAISRHYSKYNLIPSFVDLDLTMREGQTKNTLEAIRLTECPDVSIDIAIDALIDQYTQNETIKALEKFVDKLPIYDTSEIKENLASIVLMLDEKTMSSETVNNMADLMIFQHQEDLNRTRVMLGFNNTFDSVLGGTSLEDLVLIGGKRGAGKSIICSNMQVHQYEIGNVCPYFTIEMPALEVFQRNMAILSGVKHTDLVQNKQTPEDILKVIKARAGMFEDADSLVDEFKITKDRYKFEEDLVRTKALKEDNQMIIIDNRDLTITDIDLQVGKLKARFGDKLKLVVVDYLNQIKIEGNHNKFDWQPQIEVATQLKNIARKYGVIVASPYQIDDSGATRFSKGILDPANIALIVEAHDKSTNAITFGTTKIRGAGEIDITSGMNWDTLRISPVSVPKPEKGEKHEKAEFIEKKSKKKKEEKPIDADKEGGVPWDDVPA